MDCHDFYELSQWQYPHAVIARLWKSRGNLSMATTTLNQPSSLRELLLQLVAISVWGIIIHSWNSSFMEFFFFSVFVFVISSCGLLRRFTPRNDEEQWVVVYGDLPPFVRGDVAKQQGVEKKIKIEAQSGKMICLHNHFSLSSHEVRNERSIRNWKLKIEN